MKFCPYRSALVRTLINQHNFINKPAQFQKGSNSEGVEPFWNCALLCNCVNKLCNPSEIRTVINRLIRVLTLKGYVSTLVKMGNCMLTSQGFMFYGEALKLTSLPSFVLPKFCTVEIDDNNRWSHFLPDVTYIPSLVRFGVCSGDEKCNNLWRKIVIQKTMVPYRFPCSGPNNLLP